MNNGTVLIKDVQITEFALYLIYHRESCPLEHLLRFEAPSQNSVQPYSLLQLTISHLQPLEKILDILNHFLDEKIQ